MLNLTVLSGLFESIDLQKGTRVLVNLGTSKEPYIYVGTVVARSAKNQQYRIKFDDDDTYVGSITNSATGILGLSKSQRRRKTEIKPQDLDNWIDTTTWFATSLADSNKPGPTLQQFMTRKLDHKIEEIPSEATLLNVYTDIVKRYQYAPQSEKVALLQNLGKIGSDLIEHYKYDRQKLEAVRNSVPIKVKPKTKEVPRTIYKRGNLDTSRLTEEQTELLNMLDSAGMPVVKIWDATPDTDFAFDLGHLTIEQSGEDGTWQIVERVGNNYKFWPETRSLRKLVKQSIEIYNTPQIVRATLFINPDAEPSKRAVVISNTVNPYKVYKHLVPETANLIVVSDYYGRLGDMSDDMSDDDRSKQYYATLEDSNDERTERTTL